MDLKPCLGLDVHRQDELVRALIEVRREHAPVGPAAARERLLCHADAQNCVLRLGLEDFIQVP